MSELKFSKSLKALKTELTLEFSHFIKLRDTIDFGKVGSDYGQTTCISCNNWHTAWGIINGKIRYTRSLDAGHFYGKGAYPAIRYDEHNVACQCAYCNLNAIQTHFKDNLIQRFGEQAIFMLDVKKNNSCNYKVFEYQALIEEYKYKNSNYMGRLNKLINDV